MKSFDATPNLLSLGRPFNSTDPQSESPNRAPATDHRQSQRSPMRKTCPVLILGNKQYLGRRQGRFCGGFWLLAGNETPRPFRSQRLCESIYSIPFGNALIVCTQFWIQKCKAKEQYGENCKPDVPMTDEQFRNWKKDPGDIYTGISCLQNSLWLDEIVRRNPEPFIPK